MFSRKTNNLIYEYKLSHSAITRTYSVKDLRVYLDSKLHFHDHVNSIFSQCIKLLGLIHCAAFNFSTLECMLTLYITLVRPKIEYASVVWNFVTSTDANKLERIQRKFMAPCFRRFFPQVNYSYDSALDQLNMHTLYVCMYKGGPKTGPRTTTFNDLLYAHLSKEETSH
jgi:hypothetical protein